MIATRRIFEVKKRLTNAVWIFAAAVFLCAPTQAQAQESSAVPDSASPEELEQARQTLNARMREAMQRRMQAAQQTAEELSSAESTPSSPTPSTPPPRQAPAEDSDTPTPSKRPLPSRTIKVGGGSTMNLRELIQSANQNQGENQGAQNQTPQNTGQPGAPQAQGVNQINQPQNNQPGAPGQNVFGQQGPQGQPAAGALNPPQQDSEQLYEMVPNGEANPFDLVEVLARYAMISGRQPIRRASVNNDPQIYINFRDLTAREAMNYIEAALALNGISILHVGEKFFQVIETTEASKVGQPMEEREKNDYNRLGSFTQRAVQLEFIPTDVAKQVLDPLASPGNDGAVMEIPTNNLLILSDYEPNVKQMLEMVEEIDVEVPLEVELELIPIRYALAEDIAQVLGTLTPSGAVSTGSGSRSSRFGSNRSSRFGGNNNALNNAQPQAGGANATQNRSAFQNRLQNIVNRAASGDFQILGDTKIIPDERTNSILVFANKTDLRMIKQIIEKLDVVQAQVLIEAVVMEVAIGENEDIGVSILNRNPNGTGGSITDPGLSDTFLGPGQFASDGAAIPGLPSGFSYFSSIGSDINVAVRALASDRRATVLQRPRIQTFHAREASIIVGERRPFVGGTFFGFGGNGSNTQINYEEISVELNVLPLINQEGLVVLEVQQIVKDLNGFETIDGNRVPVVASREATASVAVQDGQTIILGGMITTNKSVSHSGVPVMKDIPVLGNLFRSKTETENQVELVVLIKPTVLPTPEIAKDVAADELDRLIATKQAQLDIQRSRERMADKFEYEKSREERRMERRGSRAPFDNYPIPDSE